MAIGAILIACAAPARGHGPEFFENGDSMKGVVLAGGTGSRLSPLRRVTNKHLLPVYDKPMIYYPIQTLVNAGIQEILLVTGGRNAGEFLRLLGNGRERGLAWNDPSLAITWGISDPLVSAKDARYLTLAATPHEFLPRFSRK